MKVSKIEIKLLFPDEEYISKQFRGKEIPILYEITKKHIRVYSLEPGFKENVELSGKTRKYAIENFPQNSLK